MNRHATDSSSANRRPNGAPVPPVTQLFRSDPAWDAFDSAFIPVWQQARDIDGWLSEQQARILFRAATLVPDNERIVEIGSHHGRSTVFLGSAKDPGIRMMAIDPFDDPRWGGGSTALASFQATLERFNLVDSVDVFRGLSVDAASVWDGQDDLGLLFVDGAHDRASVLTDIDGWEQQVAPGGLVAFHDAFSSVGVTRAIIERHAFSRRFRFVGSERSLVVFQRTDLGLSSIVRTACQLAGELPYFGRNIAVKLALRREWDVVLRAFKYRAGDDLF